MYIYTFFSIILVFLNMLVYKEDVVTDESIKLLKIPPFLTEQYLESVIKHFKHDETIKVLSTNFSEAVPVGLNFASLLLRVDVTVTYIQNNGITSEEVQHLIIKTEISDPNVLLIMKRARIYSREMIMYERILPKFQKLLESIGDDDKLYSPALFVDTNTNTIILKDLSKEGFKLVPRQISCDTAHVNLLINKIAKFHACSVVLNAQGDESFKEFDKRIKVGKRLFKAMTAEVRSWPGYNYYAEKLEKMQEFMIPQAKTLCTEGTNSIDVLIHGDLQLNNVMFQYDKKGKLIDLALVKLELVYMLEISIKILPTFSQIDFQSTQYQASPIFDLLRFIYTSTEDHIKFYQLDALLKRYYDTLNQTLIKFAYKGRIPTMFEFYQDYIQKSFYGR